MCVSQRLLACLFFVLLSSPLLAQKSVTLVEVSIGGEVSVRRVTLVHSGADTLVIKTGSTLPPIDPTDPDDPSEPKTLEGKVRSWSESVIAAAGDGDQAREDAAKLAVVYREIKKQTEKGRFRTKQQAIDVTNSAVKTVLSGSDVEWSDLFDDLFDELERLEADGRINDLSALAERWEEISDGFDEAAGTRLNLEQIIEIIRLIISLISGLPSGVTNG